MSKPPPGIARFDSAAAMAQALASALRGERLPNPTQPALPDACLPAINALPRRLRDWVYILGGMRESIDPAHLERLDFEPVAQWIAGLYPPRAYECAFIGATNGAMVHLAAALRAPWLPQTFLCPVRAPSRDPDDAGRAFREGRRVADALAHVHPELAIHHVQDPNEDRLMLHAMRYFRLKHRRLPPAYRQFLVDHLGIGATLYVVNCTRDWAVTRTNESAVFQFGALGGATETEYLQGGERVRAFLAEQGSALARWEPPPADTRAPEAEWGFDATLTDDLLALASEMGWRVVELRYEDPEALSFVTAEIYRQWYEERGIRARRLLVDSFMLLDPLATLKLHAIPFWLLLGVEPSASALERYLDETPEPFDEIDLTLFSHGVDSLGLAPIERWRGLLARATTAGRFAAVDTARFPRDFATFARFEEALAQLRPQLEIPAPLRATRFEILLQEQGERYGVTCEALAAPA